jgi:hypothetical protein
MIDNIHTWLNVACILTIAGAATWASVLRYTTWGDE